MFHDVGDAGAAEPVAQHHRSRGPEGAGARRGHRRARTRSLAGSWSPACRRSSATGTRRASSPTSALPYYRRHGSRRAGRREAAALRRSCSARRCCCITDRAGRLGPLCAPSADEAELRQRRGRVDGRRRRAASTDVTRRRGPRRRTVCADQAVARCRARRAIGRDGRRRAGRDGRACASCSPCVRAARGRPQPTPPPEAAGSGRRLNLGAWRCRRRRTARIDQSAHDGLLAELDGELRARIAHRDARRLLQRLPCRPGIELPAAAP